MKTTTKDIIIGVAGCGVLVCLNILPFPHIADKLQDSVWQKEKQNLALKGISKQNKPSNKTYQKCLFDNAIGTGNYRGVETDLYNNMACQIGVGGHAMECIIYPDRADGASLHCNHGGEYFICEDTSEEFSCCYNPNWECLIDKNRARMHCTSPEVFPVCTGKWKD